LNQRLSGSKWGCVYVLVISGSFKSCIARVTIHLRESTACIMVEIISIVSLGSGGRKHQLNIITMILHDAVIVPSDIAPVANPLLQSREIIPRVEIGHYLMVTTYYYDRGLYFLQKAEGPQTVSNLRSFLLFL